MKTISLSVLLITFIFMGCWHPYVDLVNKEDPESKNFYIYDDKDSLNIEVGVQYHPYPDKSLAVEVGVTYENNSKDTLILKNNTELFISKHYTMNKVERNSYSIIGDIIIYPKSIKEYTGVVFNYEMKEAFLYNQKEHPKVPKDEEVTFKLPTLIKGNRQITFKELHFVKPEE